MGVDGMIEDIERYGDSIGVPFEELRGSRDSPW
jgi:hypothetical protein